MLLDGDCDVDRPRECLATIFRDELDDDTVLVGLTSRCRELEVEPTTSHITLILDRALLAICCVLCCINLMGFYVIDRLALTYADKSIELIVEGYLSLVFHRLDDAKEEV